MKKTWAILICLVMVVSVLAATTVFASAEAADNSGAAKNNEFEIHTIFEAIMILSFGASWPLNVIKSLKTKSTKGKSVLFLFLILFGYVAGIVGKFIAEPPMYYIDNFWTKGYILVFYFLNFFMVFVDTVLYFRNKRLEKLSETK